ncbi:Trypanosome variant surface glycoprotein (A-type), putative [Trypanosoma equiperdum]|uniref:Trypanosome variant surface glycoprotein (A-type), putative n=1 Tax=Trypanosoma equiperdum TaxID=5694 RepID=A0A1G4IDD5_TRYEQ|nr:Trypanosome variant surface glycoprotein (A-type), putative [Trypanosoma equiperdum]
MRPATDRVFAANSDDVGSATNTRILQIYFKRKAAAAAAKLGGEAITAALKATHAASYGQGRLTEFLAIAVQTASSGKSCILDNSGSPVAAAKTLTGAQGATCSLELTEVTPTQYDLNLIDANGFKNALRQRSGSTTHQTHDSKQYPLLTAHAAGLSQAGALTADAELALGTIRVGRSNNSALTITDLHDVKTQRSGTKASLYKMFTALEGLKELNTNQNDNNTITADDPDLQAPVLAIALRQEKPEGKDMKNEVEKLFSTNPAEKVNKLLQAVYSKKSDNTH